MANPQGAAPASDRVKAPDDIDRALRNYGDQNGNPLRDPLAPKIARENVRRGIGDPTALSKGG